MRGGAGLMQRHAARSRTFRWSRRLLRQSQRSQHHAGLPGLTQGYVNGAAHQGCC